MIGVGHRYLATMWYPNLPPGALLESKKGCFSVVCGPIWLMLRWMVGRERRSWEEDEEEVGDGEGGNECLRSLSEMRILTW